VNAPEFNKLNVGMTVRTRRSVSEALRKRTTFNPVAFLFDSADYAFLHVGKFMQLEPNKLIDVRAELDPMTGNEIGTVWHLSVFE
jgi:hypothetical protein